VRVGMLVTKRSIRVVVVMHGQVGVVERLVLMIRRSRARSPGATRRRRGVS
jgi:hypothetical protein